MSAASRPAQAIAANPTAVVSSHGNSDLFVKGCFESMKIFQDTGEQEQVRVVVPNAPTAPERSQPVSSALWMAESELMKELIRNFFVVCSNFFLILQTADSGDPGNSKLGIFGNARKSIRITSNQVFLVRIFRYARQEIYAVPFALSDCIHGCIEARSAPP
jgi:hypothetical protein